MQLHVQAAGCAEPSPRRARSWVWIFYRSRRVRRRCSLLLILQHHHAARSSKAPGAAHHQGLREGLWAGGACPRNGKMRSSRKLAGALLATPVPCVTGAAPRPRPTAATAHFPDKASPVSRFPERNLSVSASPAVEGSGFSGRSGMESLHGGPHLNAHHHVQQD